MALRELFIRFMDEYGSELADAKRTEEYKRPFGNLVRQDIAEYIRAHLDARIYKVKGSVGAGRWTDVPWVAVFDNRITTSAQRGVYIVYLLNKDTKELYLTLNQGATDIAQTDGLGSESKLAFTGIASASDDKTTALLRMKAAEIREKIGNIIELNHGSINTGSKPYDAGCIYYKKYSIDDIPADNVLFDDLSSFVEAYQKYYELVFRAGSEDSSVENTNDWWPSLIEYDPQLTKEQWVEYFNDHSVCTEKRLKALAQLYDIGGNATMVELEIKYGKTADYYRNVLSSIGERAVKYFGIQACNQPNAKYWPCIYFGRHVGKDRPGDYEWKLRDEVKEALQEIDILQYLGEEEEKEGTFSLPDAFSDRLSRRFVNSLLAKPFVILTGNSGTGKTRIATRFAKYMEVQLEDGKNYELISVGADWTDNTAILGYYNPLGNEGRGEYCDTAILRLFIRAKENPEYPFFLILDEMNLSHVERYFSDFLSHMETPDTGFKIDHYSDEEFTYPDNLFVIGTVNIDETTYMFSPKVLDRANVIEFKPDKDSIFALFDQQVFEENIESADKPTVKAFMSLARKIRNNDYNMDLSDAKEVFKNVYNELEINGFEFAYRTVKEICRYMYAANELAGESSYEMNELIDEQIIQKLLPKIYGNKRAIGDMLAKLHDLFEKDNGFELSAEKISQMQRKLEITQYVSFI